MGELPPKLFFRIGEVAGLVGVEPHVLRYWEREFRSIRPTKSAKGQRVYSRKDVENLLRVRDLLYRDGFTIAGAKKKLSRHADDANGGDEAPDRLTPSARTAGVGREAPHRLAPSSDGGLPHDRLTPSPDGSRRGSSGGLPPDLTDPALADPSLPVREKLVALRSEVEEFLVELSRPIERRGGKTDA